MELHRTPNENNPPTNNEWSGFKKAVVPLAVAGVAIVGAPLVLSAAGFGVGGIVKGTLAAKWMSTIAVRNGVGIDAKSFFSLCQSAGVRGLAQSTLFGIGVGTGTATVAVQEGIHLYKKGNNPNDGNNGDTEENEESEDEDEKGSDEF